MSYIDDALLTLSDNFYQGFDRDEIIEKLSIVSSALQELDDVKKHWFYGKCLNAWPYLVNGYRPETLLSNGSHADNEMVLHGIVGIATESGELIEALSEAVSTGKSLDRVNLIEEMGDIFWYMAILAKSIGITFEEVQERNIAKLRKRYPARFRYKDAIDRNLKEERKALEGE